MLKIMITWQVRERLTASLPMDVKGDIVCMRYKGWVGLLLPEFSESIRV